MTNGQQFTAGLIPKYASGVKKTEANSLLMNVEVTFDIQKNSNSVYIFTTDNRCGFIEI